MIKTKYPTTKPSLNLDFANTKSLDPRITFRRGTPGTYYDGVTHVKAEENLIDYSEDFSQWGYDRIVQTSGQSAPDGSTDAYKIEQEGGQTNSGYAKKVYNSSINQGHTFSVYAKAGTNRNYVVFYPKNLGLTYFDLANGVVANADERHDASISDAGNGWYRCSITYTPISTSDMEFTVYFSDNNSSITVADDGGFIYLWGAQLEQRDTVTSYTATNGTPITKYQPKLMTAAADTARFDHDPITGESKGLLIEEQRTNLITYSQQIEQQTSLSADFNKWVVSRTNIGEGVSVPNALLDLNAAIAPDGTLSASKFYTFEDLLPPATYQQVYVTDTTPETLTFSVFAKAGQENRYLQLFIGSNDVSGNPFANFNLFNGTISRDDSSIASIEDHGNGWYRCIITFTTTSTSDVTINPIIYLIDDDNAERGPSVNGDGYSGIYIWGAQLEAGSFATSYIKSSGATAGTVRSADNASITGENFSSWYRQDEGSVYLEASTFDAENGGSRVMFSDGTYNNRFMFTGYGTYFMFTTSNGVFQSSFTGPKILNKFIKKAAAFKEDDFAGSIQDFNDFTDTDAKMPIGIDRVHFYNVVNNSSYINGHIKKLAYYPQRLTNEQLQNLTK